MGQLQCKVIPVSSLKDNREIEDEINAKIDLGWQFMGVAHAEPGAVWFRVFYLAPRD